MVVAIVKGERGAERAESGQAPKWKEKARPPFRGAWCSEGRQCDEELGDKAVKQDASKNRSMVAAMGRGSGQAARSENNQEWVFQEVVEAS